MENKENYQKTNHYEINSIDLIVPILKHAKLFILIVIFFIFGSIIYALNATVYFKSRTAITTTSSSSEQSGLASIASSFGVGIPGGGANDETMLIVNLLSSRTLIGRIFENLQDSILIDLYPKNWQSIKLKWDREPNTHPTKQEMITFLLKERIKTTYFMEKALIEVTSEFRNPELSRRVLDEMLTQMDALLKEKNITSAQRNKNFIETQLLKNKKELINDATKISEFYKEYNVPNQSTLMQINLDKDTRPPDLDKKTTLYLSEESTNTEHTINNVPAKVYLDYLNNRQNVLKMANTMLEQQYIQASIEAEKNRPSFYVIDSAETPLSRSRPKRTMIVIIACLAGICFSFFTCHLLEYSKKNKSIIKEKLLLSKN